MLEKLTKKLSAGKNVIEPKAQCVEGCPCGMAWCCYNGVWWCSADAASCKNLFC